MRAFWKIHSCWPVNSDRHKREDAGRYRAGRYELGESTIRPAERPVVVQHVDEVEERVEDGDQCVGDGQIHQEVVDYRAHALVGHNDPDDDDVSAGRHSYHGNERDNVDELEVPRKNEWVSDRHLFVFVFSDADEVGSRRWKMVLSVAYSGVVTDAVLVGQNKVS